jgi:DNA-binding response OmpR family regulator
MASLKNMEMRILIVEDNAIQALVLEIQLNKIGYNKTLKVLNADKAKESVTTFDPDLMLVDINLGDGDSGIDFVNQTNGSRKRHVIFISGNSDEKHKTKAKESGSAGFLVKPIRFDDLKNLICDLPVN